MELYIYSALTILALVFSLKNNFLSNPPIFFVFWIVAYISLIVVVRKVFDFDIRHYAASMSFKSLSIYYLKEPVVWLGHRYIFSWVQNPYYVFLLSDLLIGLILFQAFVNFKLPQYAFFSFLIFFPFVLGMQNVYRQWVSNILFIYSFSLVWCQGGKIKTYTSFMFSVLSHHAAAIFVPLLFIRSNKRQGNIIWYGSFVVAMAGFILGANTKSSSSAGNDTSLIYFLLIMFFPILIVLLDRGIIRRIRVYEYKSIFTILLLSGSSTIFLASAGSERISMFGLMVVYPILVLIIEDRFKRKLLPRAIFSLMGFAPMLLFGISVFLFGCDQSNDVGVCVRAP